MRIIGGEHGGRKFNPPNKMPYTRPTTDIAKEGLFNVLQNNLVFEEIRTLDLFGGTGSISYELASRGVKDLTIVEKDVAMYDFIKKTAATLRIENIQVIKMDVFKFINNFSSISSTINRSHSNINTFNFNICFFNITKSSYLLKIK